MDRKSIYDGIEILPLLVFIILTKLFPFKTKVAIGGFLISLFIQSNVKFKRRVFENLDIAIPNKTDFEKKVFLKRFSKLVGTTFTELIFNCEFQRNESQFEYKRSELDPLIEAQKQGRPIIIVSAHLGPWEAVRAVLKKYNLTAGAIYKKNKNQFYEPLHLKAIKSGGEPIFSTGLSGTKNMIKYLKGGGIVAVMLDQAASDGEFFNFFGIPAKTTTSVAKIALKVNALVVPSYAIRTSDMHTINIHFEKPIANTNYKDMTDKLNTSIENKVKSEPEQWYWLHRRWKY